MTGYIIAAAVLAYLWYSSRSAPSTPSGGVPAASTTTTILQRFLGPPLQAPSTVGTPNFLGPPSSTSGGGVLGLPPPVQTVIPPSVGILPAIIPVPGPQPSPSFTILPPNPVPSYSGSGGLYGGAGSGTAPASGRGYIL